jgi:Rhodopirellula transposase DDE domain
VLIQTIAATRTTTGLRVEAVLDPGDYPTGVAISKQRLAALPLHRTPPTTPGTTPCTPSRTPTPPRGCPTGNTAARTSAADACCTG